MTVMQNNEEIKNTNFIFDNSVRRAVFYHDNCMDGYMAAWVAYGAYGTYLTSYAAVNYNRIGEIEKVIRNKAVGHIVLVDFSIPLELIIEACEANIRVTILDHHKTAIDELGKWINVHFDGVLDDSRSGAGIAWGYFMDNQEMPDAIKYTQDRDLWVHVYPESESFHYAAKVDVERVRRVFGFKEAMDYITTRIAGHEHDYVSKGKAIIGYLQMLMQSSLKHLTYFSVPLSPDIGLRVASLSVPYELTSFFADEIFKAIPSVDAVANANYQGNEMVIVSLRSREHDVSAIAKVYAGGGHAKACGYTISREEYIGSGYVNPFPKHIGIIDAPMKK
jgi:oligoribonuclease NrnB/cAMP/cGMP phosphodiesterase (DHH superfamily)